MRRRGGDGWAYQGFNYPKSCVGRPAQAQARALAGGDERKALYGLPRRHHHPQAQALAEAARAGAGEGWYRQMVGTVDAVVPGDGTVVSRVKTDQGIFDVPANYVIDCTGLEADIGEHRVLADLLEHGGAGRNPMGRLDVETHFEVRGTRSGVGRMYASGSATPAATSPASTRSSACSTSPCASPTTWPTRASCPASRSAARCRSGDAGSKTGP